MASCCGLIVLTLVVWTALAIARSDSQPSTDDARTFEERLANKINENTKRGGNVHGHIAAVNEAHGQLDKKRDSEDIPLTEEIEAANEAGDLQLYEADIILAPEEDEKRNIVKGKSKLWPSKEVPYYVSPGLGHMKRKIYLATRDIAKHTCVRFKEVPGSFNGDHIRLVKGRGCASSVGRRGGGQTLKLGKGCEYVGVVMHELMHALGIWHEQSRPDRDSYVEILWNNIAPGQAGNFKKYPHGKLDTLNLPYDTSSIMHYDRFLFSKEPNRRPTIVARGRPWKKLGGQLQGTLTANDAKEINSLFNC